MPQREAAGETELRREKLRDRLFTTILASVIRAAKVEGQGARAQRAKLSFRTLSTYGKKASQSHAPPLLLHPEVRK